MEKPLVSVLVPIFNVEPYLRQCIDSLLGQTFNDIEIILIDDGSTDGCGSIIDEYARADMRVRALHKQNSGYGDSMNQGLATARGSWISIIEPDDWAEHTMLEHLLEAARKHGAEERPVDIVKGAYQRIIHKPGAKPHRAPCAHLELVKPVRQPLMIDECPQLLSLHPSIWTAIYRKDFLDEFGIRFHPIPGAGWADNPFFIETMIAARSIVWLEETVYNYREFEDGSISHLKDWHIIIDRWNEMAAVLEKYDVRTPAILEAHAVRGCAYLEMLHADFDQSDPELAAAADAMADSLDFNLIRHSPFISKERKLAYAHHLPPEMKWKLFASWIALHVRSALS